MRFAVISDIHGNLHALEAVTADIQRHRPDAVINLGDSLSGPLLPRETAAFLMSRDWIHLAGNHERQILEQMDATDVDRFARSELGVEELAWLKSLAPARRLGGDILLCHGSPLSDLTCLLQQADRAASAAEIELRLDGVDAALILCGHSHVPRSVRSRGRLVVNPGSVGQPAFADHHPFPHCVETGSPDARYALVERRFGSWQASLISIPYPSEEMAALAAARGRPDWAAALRTGYVG